MVLKCIDTFLDNALSTASRSSWIERDEAELEGMQDEDEAVEIAILTMSLLGFLSAASEHAHFWDSAQRLNLARKAEAISSEGFLVRVEAAFSTIRNSDHSDTASREWRRYIKRYTVSGRPLGAMLLQQGLMRFGAISTSLLAVRVAQHQQKDPVDMLTDIPAFDDQGLSEADEAFVEYMTNIAMERIRLLEDGSDYLLLSTSWQQRLAFSVKANTLTIFLGCMILDEGIADSDLLLSWLEETLADSIQMASGELSNVTLKSLCLVARFDPSSATAVARLILRFIVQGGTASAVIPVAARSLAQILQTMSQDAVITTLYALGNAVSAASTSDKGLQQSISPDSSTAHNHATLNTQHATGSSISLSYSGEEENAVVYSNIVQAIVTVATCCNDLKIVALAQAMLLQKIGRVSLAVDTHIVREAASLAVNGGDVEFKALLKLFSRLSHDSMLSGNKMMVEAVSHGSD